MYNYQLTPLEQWLEEIYRLNSITKVAQLNITEFSSKLGIWVYFMDIASKTVELRGLHSINIDKRLAPRQQWEDFLHELCHVLRHAGNQIEMPEMYTEMQEREAESFQMFAAIPYSMLRKLELPETQGEIVYVVAKEFGVTLQLAKRRIEQIHRSLQQHKNDEQTRLLLDGQINKYSSENWSAETRRIMNQLEKQKLKKGPV